MRKLDHLPRIELGEQGVPPRMAYDFAGKLQAKPKPAGRAKCVETFQGGAIELWQHGRDSFAVVYGLQMKDLLTYAQAMAELGACIMHSLQCAGKID